MSSGAGLEQFVDVSFPVTNLNDLLMGLVLEASLLLIKLLKQSKRLLIFKGLATLFFRAA